MQALYETKQRVSGESASELLPMYRKIKSQNMSPSYERMFFMTLPGSNQKRKFPYHWKITLVILTFTLIPSLLFGGIYLKNARSSWIHNRELLMIRILCLLSLFHRANSQYARAFLLPSLMEKQKNCLRSIVKTATLTVIIRLPHRFPISWEEKSFFSFRNPLSKLRSARSFWPPHFLSFC